MKDITVAAAAHKAELAKEESGYFPLVASSSKAPVTYTPFPES
jgi:hypothetical protein